MTITISPTDIAALQAGKPVPIQSSAAPTGPTTAPPTQTAPPATAVALKIPVYQFGKMHWAGDWSDVTPNYASNASKGVDGSSPCIEIPATTNWEYWLPYPPTVQGSPAANGIDIDLVGVSYFTLAVKPTAPGMSLQLGYYKAQGSADDIPYGVQGLVVTQAKYGPATPVVNEWNIYKVPLADSQVSDWIYKFILQNNEAPPQQLFLDQVGFN